MTKIKPPPLYEPVIDQSGVATIPWTLFFNSIFTGDTGTAWTPTANNLTTTGAATITGVYYKLSQNLVYYKITITPGTDTSAVAGTTYFSNFPLAMRGDSFVLGVAAASNVGVGLGVSSSGSGRIYTPAWTGATVPITLIGIMEAG